MSPKRKIKLLIVDDEKDVCIFEKSYLEKRGFTVVTALTGASGVTLANKVRPDIAIIDIHMEKGIDGIEVLQRLLQAHPSCKCIMVTWDKQKALEAKGLGAMDILIKPVELKELEGAIHKAAKQGRRHG